MPAARASEHANALNVVGPDACAFARWCISPGAPSHWGVWPHGPALCGAARGTGAAARTLRGENSARWAAWSTLRAVSYYGAEPGDARRVILTSLWIVLADVVLKFLARCASCVDPLHLDAAEFARVYSVDQATCGANALFSSPITLNHAAREGMFFGLAEGSFVGPVGQLYGLALLAIAAIATVLLLRWQWRANGDPRIVGALLAGAWIEGVPRLINEGVGLSQMDVFGLSLNLGDFAFLFGLVWVISRAIGEWRA